MKNATTNHQEAMTYQMKLTPKFRRCLAILAGRLTVGAMGKDKFRQAAGDLQRNRPDLVLPTATGWELTDAGRAEASL